jgi:hypothetical protein
MSIKEIDESSRKILVDGLHVSVSTISMVPLLRAASHLEAGPIPLEPNYMKFQPFLD